jgi:hypothetical protein
MGMTYEELSIYGRLRKIFRCGPVSMFQVCILIFKGLFRTQGLHKEPFDFHKNQRKLFVPSKALIILFLSILLKLHFSFAVQLKILCAVCLALSAY